MRPLLIGAAITGMLSAGLAMAMVPASAAQPIAGAETITELIVAYEPGVPAIEAPGVATGSAAVTATELEPGVPIGFGMRTVRLGEAVDTATAERIAEQLGRSPGVDFAEPNGIVTLADTVVQPSAPWGLDRIDQPTRPLDGTYQYPSDSTGSGVTAYVIDSGIRSTHVEFTGRLSPGYAGVADGRGTEDCIGHGTHVAGTIGGTTYGVAKQVTLVPVRVFGCTGSTTLDAIVAGINWTVTHHVSGPAVANMSFRSEGSSAVDTAVDALIADGVSVVAASGNEAMDACSLSPARVADAITVNASDSSDAAASFSNFGSCTDLYAPGVGIASAWFETDTDTATISGTSMAAPHVAGAAARILDVNPGYTPAQVWTAMAAVVTPIAFTPGGGDPDRLLFASPGVAATVPGAPTGTSVTAGNLSAAVTWQAPLANGGSPLTSYSARAWDASSGGSFGSRSCTTADASALTCTITGLTNGTTYYVDVIAANAVGPSLASSPRVAALPVNSGAPSQPRSVAAAPSNQSLLVSWLAPSSSGGSLISSYTATAWSESSGGTGVSTCTASPATDLDCTISGLTNGTSYYVDVTATNTAGAGPPSSPRVLAVPATVPGAPQGLAASAADSSTTVAWQAPASTGGSTLTSYTARAWTAASDGSIVSSCQPSPATGLTCAITGLVNGTTYYVDATAANAAGSGPASAPRVVVTPAAPVAPPASGGGGGSSPPSTDSGGGGSIWQVVEVRPAFGPTTGGTRVLVLGWGFTGATSVSVGGVTAPGFTLINDATLEIVTPPGTAGWQELRVWLPNGSVPAAFEYRTPAAAPPAEQPPTTDPTPSADPQQVAVVRTLARPPARTAANAPAVVTRAAVPIRIRVSGLPRSTTTVVRARVDGRYVLVGSVRSTTSGRALLPAFTPPEAGSYLVRLTPAGKRPLYLRIVAR